jgi:predicted phosphodiesterase
MRYGVISDVHANLHALDAALGFLSTQHVDHYLCAGDLVGYGPLPNECVSRVRDLGGPCIAGNHDLIVLDRLSDERCIPLARASLRWTRTVLDHRSRAFLESLPLRARTPDVALAHGSLLDPQAYVLNEAQARACLHDLDRFAPGASIVVLGHTHRPMAVGLRRGSLWSGPAGSISLPPGEAVVLNPGAVGQSRSSDPRARVMVLDTGSRVATFHAVAYDVEGCRRALAERGLPPASCHLVPSRWEGALDALRRRVRRLASASAARRRDRDTTHRCAGVLPAIRPAAERR